MDFSPLALDDETKRFWAAVAVGTLIFLYSRYVLLAIVVGYIVHGLLSRLIGMFRRRSEVRDPTQVKSES